MEGCLSSNLLLSIPQSINDVFYTIDPMMYSVGELRTGSLHETRRPMISRFLLCPNSSPAVVSDAAKLFQGI